MKKLLLFLLLSLCLAQINFAQINPKSVAYNANYHRIGEGHQGTYMFEIRNGTLWGWGANTAGGLGDGTTTQRNSPVQIGTDNRWIEIAVSGQTLGLKSDGTLWGWGANSTGAVGDGTTVNKLTPVQIGTDNRWVSISAGFSHSLGLKSDGTLWAWGDNISGDLGDGTTTQKNSPVQIGTDNKWVSISAGAHYSLGLKSDGTLWSWGVGGYLGLGTTVDKNVPTQVGTDNQWLTIAASTYQAMAIKSNGTLWGWGEFTYGPFGTISGRNTYLSPVQVGTDNKWTSISLGRDYSIALKSDGTLWATGINTYGQVGNGTTVDAYTYFQIGTENNWVSISATFNTSFAVKGDGTLWAWGANYQGIFGNGTTVSSSIPIQLNFNNEFLSISKGQYHNLAVKTDGSLWAWGLNSFDQIGDGTNLSRNIPVPIGTDHNWVRAEGGLNHSLGLKSNGTIWSWGDNTNGQLGDGTTNPRPLGNNSILQIGTDSKWTSIASGLYSSFAIKSDGTLWAWGMNSSGQLGDGTTVQKNSPLQIGTDNKWISISAGSSHTIGLKSDGTIWAWGGNANGQLGDGTIVSKTSPVQIGTDNRWIEISAGRDHTLALRSDGTIWSWGLNSTGQLGDGTTVQKNSPVLIGTDSKWVSISGGVGHSMALKADGSLWGWGSNSNGELGDGTTIQKNSPLLIGNENTWVSIAASSGLSVGLKAQRNQFCAAGLNTNGQLGDGTTIANRNTFVCTANCVSPPGAPASSNKTICSGSTALLSATGIGILSWYNAPTGGSAIATGINFTTPVLTANTTYYVEDFTCVASANRTAVSVIVNPLPTVTAGANATIVCVGTSIVLTGGGANFYSWSGGVSNGIAFVPSATTTYTVTGTDVNNCSNTANITVTVNALPVVTANASAAAVCTGTSVTLTGGGANTYSWTGGVSNGIAFVPSITNTYTVTGTDVNNCSNTATKTITVNALPVVTANASSTTVCAGTSVTLTGGGASTYSWTGGVTNGVAFVPASTASYTVTGTDINNCSNTASTTVTVNPLPNNALTVTGPTPICASKTNNIFTVTNPTAGRTYTWTVPAGATIVSGQTTSGITVTWGTTAGSVTVTETNSCGTGTVASFAVAVNPLPNNALTVTGPAAVCASKTNNVFTVTNPAAGATYTWTVPATASIVSGQNTATLTANWGNVAGSVTVKEVNSCGTGTVVSKAVTITAPYALGSVDAFCGSTFCVPLQATSAISGGIIGIDFAINYNSAVITPTGGAFVGPVTTTYGGYSINTNTAGKVYVSVYLNNAPNATYFKGTGDIICVYFQVNAGVAAGTAYTLSTDGIEESTPVKTNMNCQVVPLSLTTKTGVAGSLLYRNIAGATLNFDPANPNAYVPATITGVNASCAAPSAAISKPDLYGNFKYSASNGVNIKIQRDIAGDFNVPVLNCSNVQSVINSMDRIQASDIATFKTTNVPIYTLLSADVNLDGKVTAGDVSLISSRSINGNNCEFPQSNYTWNGTALVTAAGYVKSKDWLFIDDATLATAAFTTGTGRNNVPVVPACIPAPTGTASCTPASTATYHAILLGDVDGNWTSANGAQMRTAFTDALILDLSQTTTNVQGNYLIPVYYQTSGSYSGMDFSIDYNNNLTIQNVSSNSYLTSVGTEFNNIENQRLMVTSYTQDPVNTSLPVSYMR